MQLNHYKKVLVLAVGGGNDSVSTLLLQLQLHKKFGYHPDFIDIVAVLPDCLDYQNINPTSHPLVGIISDNSTRSVQGYVMNAFPERILVQHQHVFPELPVRHVFGISMLKGSVGIAHALQFLVTDSSYDLILGIDVGGDFIAHKDNLDVLSPMMDGYMLYALKELDLYIQQQNLDCEMIFSIFGLGTDGESTPEMLHNALALLPDLETYMFDKEDITPFVTFYRDIVEKNRYSRTTDYTLLEITGEGHNNPSDFRGRFHVKTHATEKSTPFYGVFSHYQSPEFFGNFYMFKNINNITNLYSEKSHNGIEWFLHVQSQKNKINHELNGQSYQHLDLILDNPLLHNKSLFFGTPSRKFNEQQQIEIAQQISQSVLAGIYDYALIYSSSQQYLDTHIYSININNDIALVSATIEDLVALENVLTNMLKA